MKLNDVNTKTIFKLNLKNLNTNKINKIVDIKMFNQNNEYIKFFIYLNFLNINSKLFF